MSKIEVDAIDKQSGSTLTIGGSGTTVQLGTGASQTGFGRTGTVDWQTSIKTAATFTAANGEGYFVDTSSNAVTANLPAGSVGAIVAFKDYAQNFDTNALTISANGSDKIEGLTEDLVLNTEGIATTLIFGDATKGWQSVNSNEVVHARKFVAATGGTETTVCTNFKVHTFTGPGTFTVSCGGNASGSNTVEYLVVASGGGGGGSLGGAGGASGGGAGGFRTNFPSPVTGGLPVSAQEYTITVGAAGSPGAAAGFTSGNAGNGNTSTFSTITSAGGGGGRGGPCGSQDGAPGGSGGGASGGNTLRCGGSGNTPSVSPPQGNDGGDHQVATNVYSSAGGGGAGGVGANTVNCSTKNAGGPGVANTITGSPVTYAAGGGGGDYAGRSGGAGGTANTGNGGEGASGPANPGLPGGGGGSGIVIIRYKFQ